MRLYADADIDDLVISTVKSSDREIIEENIRSIEMDRTNYFYLPGKILHIDGDNEYLDRCMNFYKNIGIKANGITIKENDIYNQILSLLQEYSPDILVITGHDAYYSKNSNKDDLNNYQNSSNFVKAIREARKFEHNQDKLIIIAGACQSNYEDLIKAGANFASSPKRINIHALDPAIIASIIALTENTKEIDLIETLNKTKCGPDGIGGIRCYGSMFVGYPK